MSEHVIQAPFPGTFYRRPDPDAEEFVNESQRVEAGTTIGLVEVTKMFEEVKTQRDGTVAEFLVDNETPVDAGQPLVRLT